MVSQSFSILFYLKGSSKLDGPEPIYLRVTINGRRLELSTKRKCEVSKWNRHAGRATGTKEDAKILNAYLDTLQRKVYEAQRYLMEEKMLVTVDTVKNVLQGISERQRMLIEIFQVHNDQMEQLVGNGYAPVTYKRYCTSLHHTAEFIQCKFKVPDIDINKLNYEFITEYEYFLRSVRKCGHNSAKKYLKNFKKIILSCVRKGWLAKDPFIGFNLTEKEVIRTILSQDELKKISQKDWYSFKPEI